ncbi:MAG: PorP/SprF family type IX secretion system membrane protein [Bacteroidota bacterium]
MRRLYISLQLLMCIAFRSHSQDIHFSQYPYSPLNLSPAATGVFDGDVRVNALYRQQWNSVTVPYKTMGLSYDQVIGSVNENGSRNAAGIVINSDRAGDGNFATLQAMLSFARLFALNNDSIHFISGGIQAGITYRSLDISQLTFDNQFTGDVFNPMAPVNETFERDNFIYPDVNAGFGWMGIFNNTTANTGISFQHLLQPDQSFLSAQKKLPVRMQLNAGVWLKRDDALSFYPSALWMTQQEFQELVFGMEIKFNAQNKSIRKRAISLGLHYRMDDAFIPSAAVYFDQWRFGISYDINTSGLKTASNGKGGPEFNLTYIIKKIHYTAAKNNCPVY